MSDSTAPNGREDELLKQFCAEMHAQLLAGQPVKAELYLESHRWLTDDSRRAVKLILAEFSLRKQLGEAVDPDTWVSRFPRWAGELRECFAALRALPPAGRTPATWEGGTVPMPAPGLYCPVDELPDLPPHELMEMIGEGGMGRVFRARDPAAGRQVALKRLHPWLVAPAHVARFCREARAAAALNHPNIVPILAVGRFEGQIAYTMPLLPGDSLTDEMPKLRSDLRRAARALVTVARAVHHAHEHGVIHRDLKPSNILIDERGEPVVADFGLAKLTTGGDELTRTGQPLGTPAYMAPEQAAGKTRPVTAASDVWSLGVILYQAVVGQRPYTAKSSHELLRQVYHDELPFPRSVRPDVPLGLEAIILRCLEKEPCDRYGSAAELADDLERWLAGQPTEARPPSPWRRLEHRVRSWRPRAPVALAALMPALVLPLMMALAQEPPPAQDAERRQSFLEGRTRRLDAGKTEELVPPKGQPPYSRWVTTDRGRPPLTVSPRDPLHIDTWTTSLLELAPTSGRDTYTYSARMRCVGERSVPHYGLYLEHDERQLFGHQEHHMLVVRFREGRNWLEYLEICLMRYRDWEAPDGRKEALRQMPQTNPMLWLSASTIGLGATRLGPLMAAQSLCTSSLRARRWRDVSVTVTPADVTVRLDSRPVGHFERKWQMEGVNVWWASILRMAPDRTPPPPPFSPRGGLGLYVSNCRADFGPVRLRASPNP